MPPESYHCGYYPGILSHSQASATPSIIGKVYLQVLDLQMFYSDLKGSLIKGHQDDIPYWFK